MEQLVLPSGYRFRPTDSELILYYLKNKILGKELPVNIIPTIDVFSCNPDQLPLSEFTHGMPNERYFFSNRRKGRILTEDGFYHVSSTGSIYDKNKLVGFVRTLDFYHGRPNKGIKSKWTVHEFRVNPQVFQEDEDAQENILNSVACKIIHKLETSTSQIKEKIKIIDLEFEDEEESEMENVLSRDNKFRE